MREPHKRAISEEADGLFSRLCLNRKVQIINKIIQAGAGPWGAGFNQPTLLKAKMSCWREPMECARMFRERRGGLSSKTATADVSKPKTDLFMKLFALNSSASIRLPRLLASVTLVFGLCISSTYSSDFKASGLLRNTLSQHGSEPASNTVQFFRVVVRGGSNYIEVVNPPGLNIIRWKFLSDSSGSVRVTENAPPSGKTIRVWQGPNKFVDMIDTSVRDQLVDTSATIAPWVVPWVDVNGIAPIWLAFCSSDYLKTRSNGIVAPLAISDKMVRIADVTVGAVWALVPSSGSLSFPQYVIYFTEGKSYSVRDRQLKIADLPKPYDKRTTNIVFRILAWTNIANQAFPKVFQLDQFDPVLGAKSAELRLVASFEGMVTNVTLSLEVGDGELKLPSKAFITDERFSRDTEPAFNVSYITTNGRIPSIEKVRQLPVYSVAKEATARSGKISQNRWVSRWVMFVSIAILPLVVFVAMRRSRKTT